MRITRIFPILLLLAACSSELPHEAPFDENAPASKQAKAQLSGKVALENESDYSQVTLQLQNAERTYSVQTLSDGSISLTGIVPGKYRLDLGTRYFQPVSRDVVIDIAESVDLGTVTLSAKRTAVFGKAVVEDKNGNQTGGVDVTLKRTGSVRGAAGAPAFSPQAAAATGPAVTIQGRSATDGSFSIDGVPAGVYEMTAVEPGVGSVTVTKIQVTGEDGAVAVKDVVLLPMFGAVTVLGKNANDKVNTQVVTVQFDPTGSPSFYEVAFDPLFITSLGRFPYNFTAAVDLGAGDGQRVIYARFFDQLGIESTVGSDSVILDTTPPQAPVFSITNGPISTSNILNVQYSAVDAAQFELSEGACSGTLQTYVQTGSTTLVLSAIPYQDVVVTVAMRFIDDVGNATNCITQNVRVDNVPPVVGAFQINYGQAATSSNVVVISFAGVSGASKVVLSEDPGFSGADWSAFAATKTFVLSAGNGLKTVYAKVADDAGHVVALPQQTIALDTTPPVNPFIMALTPVTTGSTAMLQLSAGLVNDMIVSEAADFAGASWETYAGTKNFTLSAGDGTKTIYAKFKKSTGVETGVVSTTVVRDATAPILPSVRVNNGASVVDASIVTLNLSAVDETSGLAVFKVNATNDFTSVSPKTYQTTDVYSLAGTDGVKTVWVVYGDKAGNYSVAASTSVLLDRTSPNVSAISLQLLDGTPVVNGSTVRDSRLRLVSSVGDLTALEMQVSTTGSFSGVAWEPYSASKVIDLPNTGTPTIAAQVRDQAGHVVTLLSGINVSIDTVAPVGTVTRTSAAVTSSAAVDLLLSANESSDAQVSEDPSFTGAPWFSTAGTTYVLTAGDGLHTIYVRWRDAAGNVSGAKTAQVTLDQTPPQLASFSIAQGTQTNQQTVTLVLSAAGADSMRVAESATCGGTWEAYATSKGWTFATSTNEAKTVSVQFKDNAGNLSGCLTRSITLDTQAPAFTAGKGVVINGDAAFTTSRTVTLALNVTGAAEVLLSESATFVGAAWQPAVTTATWTLSAGEGTKSVSMKARDAAGNETAVQSDTIILDTIAPAFNTASGPAVSANEAVTLSLSATGADFMRLSENADFSGASYVTFNASAPFTLGSTEGVHIVYVQLADTAGNESIVRSVSVTLDKSAPNAPVVSVLEGAYTKTAAVTLQILADGAAEMLVSQYAPMTDATWQPFSQLKAFTLAGGQGAKTVYVRVRDGAGNTSAPSNASVTLDATGPSIAIFQAEDAGGAVITQSNSTRFYLRTAVTDATPVTVQYNATNAWSGIPAEAVQTLRAWDAAPPTLSAGENRTVYVRAVDAAGNATVAGPITVLVDTLGPTAPALSMAPALVSSPTVTLTLGAVNADAIELSEDISFLAPTVLAYTTSTPYTFLNTADGAKTLYARYVDALGNYSGIVVASVTLDQTEPKLASFTIAQSSPTKNATINLSFSAAGADFMAVSENSCATNWEAYQTAKAYAFATTVNGTKTIAVRFKDAVGNATVCLTQTIDFDDQAPQLLAAPFRINFGDAATSNATVTLVSNVVGATEIRVSEDSSLADAAWMPYSATRTFVLSAGNGTKTVYAQYRDVAGNATAVINDTIVLDTTQVGTPYISIQTDVTSSTTVTVNLGASNIDEMILSDRSDFATGTGWVGYTGVTTYTFGGADGAKTLFAKFRKTSGAETAVVSDSYILDRAAPSFSQIVINGGAQYATSNQLTLSLIGVDDTSGVQLMEYYEDGDVPTQDQFKAALVFPVTAAQGLKTVWVRFADRANNFAAPVSATIVLDTIAPSVSSLTVEDSAGSALTASNSARVVVHLTAADANPLQMLVSNRSDFAGSAWQPYQEYLQWDLPLPTLAGGEARTVYAKVRDAAGATVNAGSYALTLDTIAPSNVAIDIAGTAVTSPAVTVNFTYSNADFIDISQDPGFQTKLSFAALASTAYTFAAGDGVKTLYARFRDNAGNYSATVVDQVTLDTTAPQLASFTIDQGALTNQTTLGLALTAVDAAQMQVREGAACGGVWESFAATKALPISATDGVKTVAVRFRDGAGNTTACLTKTITLDTAEPTYTAGKGVVINNDDAYTTSRTVSLGLNVTDAAEVIISESPTFVGASWQPAVTTATWTLSAGEGVKTVSIKARDAAGNETVAQSDSIVVDTIAPAFNAASGPSVSAVEGITLALSASGASLMRLSELPDFSDTIYGAFNASAPFTLGATEGTHTVYIQLADAAGNESIVRSVNVMLDKSAPSAPVVSILSGAYTTTAAVTLQVLADGAAEVLVSQYAPMTDATWQPFSQVKAFTLAGGQGAKTVYVRVRDGAGNTSAPSTASVTLDATGPSITTFQAEDVGGAVITQSNSTRFYLRTAVTDATPVTVQYNTTNAWSGIPAEGVQTLRAWDAAPPTLSAGENRTVYVRAVDAAGNATVAGPITVLVDTLGPTAPSLAMSPALVSSPTVTLTLGAVNADNIELSEDISFLAPTVIPYSTSEPYTFLDTTDGVKTLYARYVDALGNYSAIVVASVTLDQTAPKFASFSIAQASPTKNATVNLSLAATGADFMAISENACATNWEAYQTAKAYAFATTVNGTKTLAVRFKDAAGNATACLTQTIDFDDQAPTLIAPAFRINYGDAATSNATVALVSNAVGATEVRVSEDSSLADAAWVPYSATRTFVLSAGNGTKTVYAQYRDSAGNTTAVINDTIVLDTTQVGVPYVSIQTDVTSSTTVTVNLGASNIDEMIISDQSDFSTGTGWVAYTGVTTYTFGGADGTKTLYAKFRKASGAETAVASDSYVLDRVAPSFSQILINNGADYTTSNQVTLALTGVDDTSGVQVMEYWENGDVPTQDQFKPALVFPVSAAQGTKTIWVRFADRAYNYAAPVSATIVLDSLAPAVSSLDVEDNAGNALTVSNTARVVVHLVAADANALQMLVSNRADFAGSAWQPYQEFLQWDLPLPSLAGGEARTVYAKVRDAAGNMVSAGSASLTLDTIAPSSPAIDIVGSATTSPTVTVNFTYSNADFIEISPDVGFQSRVVFAAVASTTYTFAAGDGAKTLYARFRDNADNYSATVVDQITLDTTAPQLASFSIDEGTLTNNAGINLALTAIDAAQMQIGEGATCSGTWTAYATAAPFTLTAAEGLKTVAVRYRDAAGNTTACLTKTITLDTSGPTGASIVVNGGAAAATQSLVTLSLAATDATQMIVSENPLFTDAAWESYVTQKTFALSAGTGVKTVYVRFRDAAGNVSADKSDTILFDNVAPQAPSIVVNTPKYGYASQITVPLVLSAVDVNWMMISQSAAFTDTTWTAYAANVTFELSDVQGAHTVYAKFKDDAGNETATVSANVVLDTVSPSVIKVALEAGDYSPSNAIEMLLLATGADTMKVGESSNLSSVSAIPYASETIYSASAGDGAKTVYVEFQDAAGNATPVYALAVTVDTVAPVLSAVATNAGATYAVNRFVSIALTDDGSASEMQLSEDPLFGGAAWQAYRSSLSYSLQSVNDGPKPVYVKLRDRAGNVSVVQSDSIELDTVAPTNVFVAKNDVPYDYAKQTAVTLRLAAAGANYYRVSTDGTFDTETWAVMAATAGVVVSADDGLKSVWAQFKDLAGNESQIAQTSFFLDTQAPEAGTLRFAQGDYTNTRDVFLQLSASGADFYQISTTTANLAVQPRANMQPGRPLQLADADGLHTYWVRFGDKAENYSDPVSVSIILDRTPPTAGAYSLVINNGDAFTSISIVSLALTVTGASEMQLRNQPFFDNSGWEPVTTSTTWFLDQTDGMKTVYARFRDDAGNVVGPIAASINLDSHAPDVSRIFINNGADYTNALSVQLRAEAREVTEMQYGTDASFVTGSGWVAFAPTVATNVAAGDGVKTLYMQFRDAAGNTSAIFSDSIVLDQTAPQSPSISINGGAAYTKEPSGQVNLSLSAADELSGLASMQLTNNGSFAASPADPFNTNRNWTLDTLADGAKSVSVRFRDRAGNYSAAVTGSITLDRLAPGTTSVVINNNDAWTTTNIVSLTLAAADANGVSEVMLSGSSGFGDGIWAPFTTATTYILPAVDNTHRVYAKFRDAAGNESTPAAFDDIQLDQTAPQFDNLKAPLVIGTRVVPLQLFAGGAPAEMRLSEDSTFAAASWVAFAATPTFTVSATEETKTIYAQIRDAALNTSVVRSVSVEYDTTAPGTPSVRIRQGAYISNPGVDVEIGAENSAQMLISQYAPMTDATWQPFNAVKPFTFAGTDGTKTVYVKVRDLAGNVSNAGSASALLDRSAPALLAGAIQINSNAPTTNSSFVTLTFNVTGADELQVSEDSGFGGAAWTPYSAGRQYTLTAGDGAKTVYARFRDYAGNIAGPVNDAITVDSKVPTEPFVSAAVSVTNQTSVLLTLSAVDANQMMLSQSPDFSGASWEAYATTKTFPLTGADGSKTVYAKFKRTSSGFETPVATTSVLLDRVGPTDAAAELGTAVTYVTSTGVTLRLSAVDTVSGLDRVEISESAIFFDKDVLSMRSIATYTLRTPSEDFHPIYVRYQDKAGNYSATVTLGVVYDVTPPTGTIDVAAGASSVNSQFVMVALSSAAADVAKVRVYNDSEAPTEFNYSPSLVWAIRPIQGIPTTVNVRFVDVAGNQSPNYSDVVTYDTVPPVVSSVELLVEKSSTQLTLAWQASNLTDVTSYRWYRHNNGVKALGGTVAASVTSVAVTPPFPSGEEYSVSAVYAGGLESALSNAAVETGYTSPSKGILLVDDDAGATSVEENLAPMLTAAGFTFDTVTVAAGSDGPNAATLKDYQVVVWSSGEGPTAPTLSPADLTALKSFLKSGGNLVYFGSDAVGDSDTAAFLTRWAHTGRVEADLPAADRLYVEAGDIGGALGTSFPLGPSMEGIDAVYTSSLSDDFLNVGKPVGVRYPLPGTSAAYRSSWVATPTSGLYERSVFTFSTEVVSIPTTGTTVVHQNGQALQALDNDAAKVVLPFDFQFGGVVTNAVWVSSNGVVSFQGPITGAPYPMFPTTDTANYPGSLIVPEWVDMRPGGKIFYTYAFTEVTIVWMDRPVTNYSTLPWKSTFVTSALTLRYNNQFVMTKTSADWIGNMAEVGIDFMDENGVGLGAPNPTAGGNCCDGDNLAVSAYYYNDKISEGVDWVRRLVRWSAAPAGVRRITPRSFTVASSVAGATSMRVSTDGSLDNETAQSFDPALPLTTVPSGDGAKTVQVVFTDDAGNQTTVYSDTKTLDTQVPHIATVLLSDYTTGSNAYTRSRTVTLQVISDASTSDFMRVSESPTFVDAGWVPYVESTTFTLGEGDGPKLVYVWLKDANGNVSAPGTGSITLDAVGPTTRAVGNSVASQAPFFINTAYEESADATLSWSGLPAGTDTQTQLSYFKTQDLEFSFPFYGQGYSRLILWPQGFVTLGQLDVTSNRPFPMDGDTTHDEVFEAWPMLSPFYYDNIAYARPGDGVFFATGAGWAMVKWIGEDERTQTTINVAVMLYDDGRVKYVYGDGNLDADPIVGISKGDGKGSFRSSNDGSSLLTYADTALFTPNPNAGTKVKLYYRYRYPSGPGAWVDSGVQAASVFDYMAFYPPLGSGTYEFYTVGIDEAGNTEAAPATADLSVLFDNVRPEPPASFKAEADEDAVFVSWTPSTSPDVVAYRIYYGSDSSLNGTDASEGASPVEVPNSQHAMLTNLEPGKTLYVTVTSVDHVGNESPRATGVDFMLPHGLRLLTSRSSTPTNAIKLASFGNTFGYGDPSSLWWVDLSNPSNPGQYSGGGGFMGLPYDGVMYKPGSRSDISSWGMSMPGFGFPNNLKWDYMHVITPSTIVSAGYNSGVTFQVVRMNGMNVTELPGEARGLVAEGQTAFTMYYPGCGGPCPPGPFYPRVDAFAFDAGGNHTFLGAVLPLDFSAREIALGSGYLAVANDDVWSPVLKLYDVANPAAPAPITTAAYSATYLEFSGDRLFTANGAGLKVLDAGDLSAPTPDASGEASGVITDFLMMANIGVVGHQSGIDLFEFGELLPSDVTADQLTFGQNVRAIALSDRYAYIADGTKLSIYSTFALASGGSMGLVGSYQPFDATDLKVVGQYLFATKGGDIWVFNIANPTSPLLVWSYDYPYGGSWINPISVVGTTLWLQNGAWDISDPSNPVKLLDMNSGTYTSLRSNGEYLIGTVYMGNEIRILRPTSTGLLQVGYYGPVTNVRDVAVEGNYIYVYQSLGSFGPPYWDQLSVVDISNPAAPAFVTSYTIAPAADNGFGGQSMIVHRGYLYMTELRTDIWQQFLVQIDIRNPKEPRLALRIGGTNGGMTFAPPMVVTNDNFLLVAGNGGVSVYHITPNVPVYESTHPDTAGAKIVVQGDRYVYFANGNKIWQVERRAPGLTLSLVGSGEVAFTKKRDKLQLFDPPGVPAASLTVDGTGAFSLTAAAYDTAGELCTALQATGRLTCSLKVPASMPSKELVDGYGIRLKPGAAKSIRAQKVKTTLTLAPNAKVNQLAFDDHRLFAAVSEEPNTMAPVEGLYQINPANMSFNYHDLGVAGGQQSYSLAVRDSMAWVGGNNAITAYNWVTRTVGAGVAVGRPARNIMYDYNYLYYVETDAWDGRLGHASIAANGDLTNEPGGWASLGPVTDATLVGRRLVALTKGNQVTFYKDIGSAFQEVAAYPVNATSLDYANGVLIIGGNNTVTFLDVTQVPFQSVITRDLHLTGTVKDVTVFGDMMAIAADAGGGVIFKLK